MTDSDILTIYPDANGVWVGTAEGAFLFNNFEITFSIYNEIPLSQNPDIYAFFTDSNGNTWISTDDNDGYMYKYDGVTITPYEEGINGNDGYLHKILEDNDGTLWFGSENYGLYEFDPAIDSFYMYNKVTNGLPSNSIYDMVLDNNNLIWLGTNYGVGYFDKTQDTAIYFDETNGFVNETVSKMLLMGDSLFVAYRNGFSIINVNDKSIINYEYLLNVQYYSCTIYDMIAIDNKITITTELGIIEYENGQISFNTIGMVSNPYTITEDNDGNVWFGMSSKIQIKTPDGKWKLIPKPFGDNTFSAYKIRVSPYDNTVWILTDEGILMYSNTNESFTKITQTEYPSLPTNDIIDIVFTDQTTYWLATDNGAAYFNGTDFTTYSTADGIHYSSVNKIAIAPNGNVWLSSNQSGYGGISMFDGNTWTHYTNVQTFDMGMCEAIAIDKDGNPWFASNYKPAQLFMFNGSKWINYSDNVPMVDANRTSIYVEEIVFDDKGILWGIKNNGTSFSEENSVFSYDGSNWNTYRDPQNFDHTTLSDLTIDTKGNFWIPTYTDVYYMDLPLEIDFSANIVCKGFPTTFTSTTELVNSWEWDIMNDTTSIEGTKANLVYTFEESGEFDVRFSISDGVDTNWIVKKVTVLALPEPKIAASDADTAVCFGDKIALTVGDFQSYNWSTDETTKLILVDDAGDYIVTVSNENQCTWSDTITVTIFDLPSVTITSSDADNTVCLGEEVTLTVNEFASYEWQDGSTDQTFATTETGTYSVTVTDDNECTSSTETTINVKKPYSEQIGVVTASEYSEFNIVAWEKTANVGTESYNVYREDAIGDILLGSVDFNDPGYFWDETAELTKRSYTYKLTTTDECGNESDIEDCKPHSTMQLLKFPYGNNFQLYWTKYSGAPVSYYTIYQTSNGIDLESIDAVPFTNNTYIVTNFDPNKDFRVGVNFDFTIDPTLLKSDSGPYSQSLSNLAEANLVSGTIEELDAEFILFPVPATTVLNAGVLGDKARDYTINIYSLQGILVASKTLDNVSTEGVQFDVSEFTPGMYTVVFSAEGVQKTKVFVKE